MVLDVLDRWCGRRDVGVTGAVPDWPFRDIANKRVAHAADPASLAEVGDLPLSLPFRLIERDLARLMAVYMVLHEFLTDDQHRPIAYLSFDPLRHVETAGFGPSDPRRLRAFQRGIERRFDRLMDQRHAALVGELTRLHTA